MRASSETPSLGPRVERMVMGESDSEGRGEGEGRCDLETEQKQHTDLHIFKEFHKNKLNLA